MTWARYTRQLNSQLIVSVDTTTATIAAPQNQSAEWGTKPTHHMSISTAVVIYIYVHNYNNGGLFVWEWQS